MRGRTYTLTGARDCDDVTHEHACTRTQEHEIAKKWLVSTLIQFYVDIEIMGRDFDGGRCACGVCGVRGMWCRCAGGFRSARQASSWKRKNRMMHLSKLCVD